MQKNSYLLARLAFLLLIVFTLLIVFGSRLIPQAIYDRAIFVSIGEYLLNGHRLYADIYDNKDPLFYYAVALQRVFGPIGEYVFELAMIVISGISGVAIARYLELRANFILIPLGVGIALLITSQYWIPGMTHLPATALCLLICALFLWGYHFLSGCVVGLLFFLKLIMFPLPLMFCLVYTAVKYKPGFKELCLYSVNLLLGILLVFSVILVVLAWRDELDGYVHAQIKNIWYSQNILVSNESVFDSLVSHLKTMFYATESRRLLSTTILLTVAVASFFAIRHWRDIRLRSYYLATLLTVVASILVLAVTGIWHHHLQLLYFSQVLLLIFLVHTILLAFFEEIPHPDDVSINFVRRVLIGISIVFLSVSLVKTIDVKHYIVTPGWSIELVKAAYDSPSEFNDFYTQFPAGTRFARLGRNSRVIPYEGRETHLACPDFAQYYFYSKSRYKDILDCVSTAPTVVVDAAFEILHDYPSGWPVDAQKEKMKENWNYFVDRAETALSLNFTCNRYQNIRICTKDG